MSAKKTDIALRCIECRGDFIFTAGEQEFHESKGFTEQPKRCKPCRIERRRERERGQDRGRR